MNRSELKAMTQAVCQQREVLEAGIIGFQSQANLPRVHPGQMIEGEMYMATGIECDDDGNQSRWTDMVFFTTDSVPGQTKPMKLVKFLKQQKTKRLSELPGVDGWFGPVSLRVEEVE